MLSKFSNVNIGDNVIILGEEWRERIKEGKFDCEYGTIINQYESDDRSHHGSPQYYIISLAKLADGRTVSDDRHIGGYYFYKKSQIINELLDIVDTNNKKISQLSDNNVFIRNIECRFFDNTPGGLY